MRKRAGRPPRASHARTDTEPLAEGIRKRRPPGFFSEQSDSDLLGFARRFLEQEGIRCISGLFKADRGVYHALWRRKLLDKVGFDAKFISWKTISEKDIVGEARTLIQERGPMGRREFRSADPRLYRALQRRGLLEQVGFEEKQRNWKAIGDDELIERARRLREAEVILSRTDLQRSDPGLYRALRKRGLLERIGFKHMQRKARGWIGMTDDDLVAFAKGIMEEQGLRGRKQLNKADGGLYSALSKRGLLEHIGFERTSRDWAAMTDDDLVAFTKCFMEEKGITGRKQLRKADERLYNTLRRRKLLGCVSFKSRYRDWIAMADHQLLLHAKKFIATMNVGGRGELYTADSGMYSALRKRGLLDAAFSDMDTAGDTASIRDVIDALGDFG